MYILKNIDCGRFICNKMQVCKMVDAVGFCDAYCQTYKCDICYYSATCIDEKNTNRTNVK